MGLKEVAEKFAAAKQELAAEAAKAGKESVVELFKSLFEAFEQVSCVRWRQYTPSFNDGEPCTFRISGPEVFIGDPDEENEVSWADKTPLGLAVKELENSFDGYSAVLEEIFGDGYEIKVLRDGRVEVNDYYE